jgi:3-phosphoshikimate 1-carboxyvinyltransferase
MESPLKMYSTDFLDIPPLVTAGGCVTLPGSKSISNRVLLLAALSQGTTTIHDLLDSDDTRVMLDALRALGCQVENAEVNQKQVLQVTGLGGRLSDRVLSQFNAEHPLALFLGNAGTAMRPLTAALSLLGGHFQMSGVARMHERPIGDLVDALRQLGSHIDYLGQDGYPPLKIAPAHFKNNGPISVRGDVSSQFLTALLMALPLVAEQDIVIEVVGELISKPYIDITLQLLARFGIQVQREGWQRFTIPAGSRYQSPGEMYVEADASSASYFIALGALAGVEPLRIQGVGLASIQGDIQFVEAAQAMGAIVTGGPNWLEVSRAQHQNAQGQWALKAIDLDCNHIPDAAMTLAVMALFADGPTTLRNIASWRVKETDRIAAMAMEARKLGATVEEGPDWLRVHPLPKGQWRSASIHTYDDHRVAMCFSLAAFNPAGITVRIEDPKCVAKTFPDYFETLFSVVHTPVENIPVICVDGPTASGKGTLAGMTASRLGYLLLDSGALYRLVGLAARQAHLPMDAVPGQSAEEARQKAIADCARQMSVQFEADHVLLNGQDVSRLIRTEAAGMDASSVSAIPAVRQALHELQLRFRRLPGLVADGRDMGTVVFPDAPLKVFLTASAEKRAERRHKQLISKGISANIAVLLADLMARDIRDSTREIAPLKPADNAKLLDNSELSIDESVAQVLAWWQDVQQIQKP